MPDIPQLVAAIDSRLAAIAVEISALDAAKAELAAPPAGGRPPALTSDAIATRSRRRTPRRPKTPAAQQPKRRAARTAPTRSRTATGTRPRAAAGRRGRAGGGAVRAETLERLLGDTSAGLSANAIARQAGAGYAPTLKLLHELQAAGQVRRSGARRSTVWQLITDEDRIAQRAAELERLRGAPGQRRRRARAS